ncbi:MAG: hypothetical protein KAS97_02040, partial [Candidatus Aminicenantes bacterium]|nr:hypothetical protein [Candidatus Aminicenantes bacterium]
MRAWIFLLLSLSVIPLSFSQELNFRNFDIEHGLVQTQITSILEDSKGFIWIGTYGGGLSRFNGRNFETFDRTRGLTSERVFSIYEDNDNILWIGTYKGVYKFDGSKFEHMSLDIGFPRGQVWDIIGGENRDIFFTDTRGGVIHYRNGKIEVNPE